MTQEPEVSDTSTALYTSVKDAVLDTKTPAKTRRALSTRSRMHWVGRVQQPLSMRPCAVAFFTLTVFPPAALRGRHLMPVSLAYPGNVALAEVRSLRKSPVTRALRL